MNNVDQKDLSVFPLLIAIFISSSAFASGVDELRILKISGKDRRAVVKTPDGKMQIIKAGDPIGDHGKVTEIAAERVVLEEQKGKETEKVIVRLVNGKQKVERVRKTGEYSSLLLAPAENDKKTKKRE